MKIVYDTEDIPICMVPIRWVRGLDKAKLESLMHMPYFSYTTEFNACVKQLLVCFDGRFLWLKLNNSVDVEMVVEITRIPLVGIEPTPFFRKYWDSTLTNKLKEKYELKKYTQGFVIASLNDIGVQFVVKFLSSNLLCKM